MDLVLASTSPHRRALLERLGVPFRCRVPLADEEALKREAEGLEPDDLASSLATAKAASLKEFEPGATLIGSDQVVAIEGHVFGKPGSVEVARRQLTALSGRTHELFTALAVIKGDRIVRHVDRTCLRMRMLDAGAIARYVEADRPLDCAGAYMIERLGITLFERIEAEDHTAIVGLPLIALTTILRDLGHPIP